MGRFRPGGNSRCVRFFDLPESGSGKDTARRGPRCLVGAGVDVFLFRVLGSVKTLNKTSQATPVLASLLVLSQVPGTPEVFR
jgi:hypothetical protein